jgi:hypothetical protein
MNGTRKSAASIYARVAYVALALATIGLGLAVHSYGDALSPTARDKVGDIVWAAMIAWLVAAIAPRSTLLARSVVAVAICFAVELSQLYHTPALDTLRRTTMGQLTLGSGFDLRDLLAYVAGVLAAGLIERAAQLWRGRKS